YRQQFDKVCACILNRHSRRIQRIITHLAVAPLKRSQQRDTSRGGDCAATRYEQQKESAKCEVLSKKSHSGSKGDPVWPSAEFPHSSVKTQHPVLRTPHSSFNSHWRRVLQRCGRSCDSGCHHMRRGNTGNRWLRDK